jgi:hypothetical protein
VALVSYVASVSRFCDSSARMRDSRTSVCEDDVAVLVWKSCSWASSCCRAVSVRSLLAGGPL